MLPNDIKERIVNTFNRKIPSTSWGQVAHAHQDDLVDSVRLSMIQPGSTTLIYGHSGVGKTSLLTEAVERLLGPEQLYAPFARRIVLQASSLSDGVGDCIRTAVAEFADVPVRLQGAKLLDDHLADLLQQAKALLIMENLQGAVSYPKALKQLFSLIKHLGNHHSDFPHVRIALELTLPYERLHELVPEGRFPLEQIEIPPWPNNKLTEIIENGSGKCGLKFHSAVQDEIVALSCGIPATVHILAQETSLQAVRAGLGQRDTVTKDDLEKVVTPTQIRQLTSQLMQGIDYLGQLRSVSFCEQALVGFAGKASHPFKLDEVVERFGDFWGRPEIAAALSGGRFIGQLPYDDTYYYAKDNLASSAALLYLRSQMVAGRSGSPNVSAVYKEILRSPEKRAKGAGSAPSIGVVRPMITVLFLAASPTDAARLRLDQEAHEIDQALRQTEFRDKFDFQTQWAVRVRDVQSYLLRYRPAIVHFSGHGSASGEIILEDDDGKKQPVNPRALGRLFSVLKDDIRCVVLNACYSEPQAQAIAEHIDCVIGMSKAIPDKAAIAFSASFYEALGFGRSVQTAFDLGCNLVELSKLAEQDIPKLLAPGCDCNGVVFVR
jgi:hypothetical protein